MERRLRVAAARKPAATTTEATLAKLAEHFPVEDHKTNPKGYTYIAIEKVIGRFNEVLGANWDLEITSVETAVYPGHTYGARNPKMAASAVVTVKIEALLDGRLVTRMGVGADNGAFDDLDKLVKTALAEAIKKTGHQYGIGLYLWDEEERALIEAATAQGMTGVVQAAQQQVAASMDPQDSAAAVAHLAPATSAEDLDALKNKVADIAVLAGVQRTGPAIAAHFGIAVELLQDETTLRGIIAANVAA